MSISTERGDGGETSLPGGSRISKADLRVEVYGTFDELISAIGLARALCPNADLREFSKSIQRELFKVGSAVATPPESRKAVPEIDDSMVQRLTDEVHRAETTDGLLADWLWSAPLSFLYPVFIHTGGVHGLAQKRRPGFTACAPLM